jgi:hypothetical protein
MEALRNHAQHRSLPTRSMSFPVTRDKSSSPSKLRFRVVPSVDVAALEDDRRFKRSVLAELRMAADKHDRCSLLPFIRAYVESFGRIHTKIRGLTQADLKEADRLILDYRAKALEKFGGGLAGLVAVERDHQGCYKEREYMTDRPTRRRRDLEKKNQYLDRLSLRYVSSES